jgi:hypothetical protein
MRIDSRKKDDRSSGASVKLRWVELDVEGGTGDLVEGFKSFATALVRGAPMSGSVRSLAPTGAAASAPTTVIEAPTPLDEEPDAVRVETSEEVSSGMPSGDGSDRTKRRPAPKAPRFLSDLDLTKTQVQLADFVREKNPDGDMEKYAVIAAWFKQCLSIEEVTIDHVFTAYKALGWHAQLPDDPSQTFRNLKSNKNWVDGGSKRGAYKINWNGESAVNKMGAGSP